MEKANPTDLRKCVKSASVLIAAGILFVPMPCVDKAEHDRLILKMDSKLEIMVKQIEDEENDRN